MSFLSDKQFQDSGYELHNSLAFYRNFAGLRVLNPDPTEAQLSFTRNTIATRVNEAGLIETVSASVPRFDFDPITRRCRGLLMEESRTNQIHSLSTMGGTLTSNFGVSPTGATDSIRFQNQINVGSYVMVSGNSILANTPYTFSFFAKSGSGNSMLFFEGWAGNGLDFRVDCASGSITNTGTNIQGTSVVDFGNGWRRYIVRAQMSTSGHIFPGVAYLGAYGGSPIQHSVELYGWQLEAGHIATSYIPTTNASVTRNDEFLTAVSSEFIKFWNRSQGTWYSNVTRIPFTTGSPNSRILSYDDVTFELIHGISWDRYPIVMGSGQFGSGVTTVQVSDGVPLRLASTYEKGSATLGVANNLGIINTGVNTYSTETALVIGGKTGTNTFNGHIQEVAYFNRALSPVNLIALTT